MDIFIKCLLIGISVGWIHGYEKYLYQFPPAVISRIKAIKDPYCKVIGKTPADGWWRVGHNAINELYALLGYCDENTRNSFGKVSTCINV